MSVFLKPGVLKVKDDQGNYSGINILAEQSTQQYVGEIENKGQEVLDSLPDDYTEVLGEIDDLREDFANCYSLKCSDAQLLADSTDYDTLKTPGNYYVNSGAKASTMVHCPVSTAHRLTIVSVYDSLRLKQIVDNPTTVYIRYWNGSVWSNWESFAYDSQIDTKLAGYEPLKSTIYTSVSNSTDYNSLTTPGVYRCASASVAQTLSNCPVSEAHCLIVRQTSTSDRYSQMIIANSGLYFRYNTGIWGIWNKTVTNGDIATAFISSPSLGDADLDTIRNQNTFYLIADSYTYTNVPDNLRTGYLEVLSSASWTIQKFFNLSGTKMWIRRIKNDGVASSWTELGTGSGGGTIENTYNITTSPTITTDTNGWLQAVDTDTADETGKTDMTGAIMSMLTDTGYCHLGEGVFYVSGNIDLPDYAVLCGCGEKTEIRLLQSVTSGYAVKLARFNTIKDIIISGSRSNITPTTAGTRNGIHFVADYEGTPQVKTKHSVIENVIVKNFSGSGLYSEETTLSPEEGLFATNLFALNCYVGINLQRYSEFNRFVNAKTFNCHYGVINNGGNNIFTSCIFRANNTAFYIDGSFPNSAHGSLIGCEFAHIGSNEGIAIKMENVSNGFMISDCILGYCYSDFDNCSGINFTGCNFIRGTASDNKTVVINGGATVMFTGCLFAITPVITITNNNKVKFNACYERSTGNPVSVS